MPKFRERNLYMHKTRMDDLVLPHELMDYKTVIVDMFKPLMRLDDVCYITIHEKRVINETHRRSGVHVDFNWYEDLKCHGGTPQSGWGPAPSPGHSPAPRPQWKSPFSGGHGSHGSGRTGNHSAHKHHDNINGGMLLVSNFPACKIYNGTFDGNIGDGGCCKDIDLSGLEEEIMPANEVFFINAVGIHESLPITGIVERSLVRVNFHPDYIIEL